MTFVGSGLLCRDILQALLFRPLADARGIQARASNISGACAVSLNDLFQADERNRNKCPGSAYPFEHMSHTAQITLPGKRQPGTESQLVTFTGMAPSSFRLSSDPT